MLGLGDHAPCPAPTSGSRLLQELGKHTRRLFGFAMLLRRLLHLWFDPAPQPLVACEAEHVLDAVLLAPGHQLFPAETGIGPQNDLHRRPALADLFDNPLHLRFTARRGILIGGAQTRTQQVLAAEGVQL